MQMLHHKNVVSYFISFPYKRQIWLVMPLLVGGSCASVSKILGTRNGGGMPENIMAYILKETAEAIAYCHRNQQIHRDLKACNILVSDMGNVLLSDFGMSASLRDRDKRHTFVGTPCWMAPEILLQDQYDTKVDVWSFGITCLEIAQGEAPHQRSHPLKVMKLILDNDPPSLRPGNWDASFMKIVKSCLQKNPLDRPSMDEVINKIGKKFFAKVASPRRMSEYIRNLPRLEDRLPVGAEIMRRQMLNSKRSVSTEYVLDPWDFSSDTDDEDVWNLAEHEV